MFCSILAISNQNTFLIFINIRFMFYFVDDYINNNIKYLNIADILFFSSLVFFKYKFFFNFRLKNNFINSLQYLLFLPKKKKKKNSYNYN